MKKKNIFESVQFLNEGIGIMGTLAIAGTVIITVAAIKDKIDRESDKKKIKKALKNLSKDSCKNISERIKITRSISRDVLYKNISNISNSDKYKIDNSNVSIYGCLDKDDKLLAYIIKFHLEDGAIYGLVDKSITKIEQEYIYALLEYKMNYFGKNLKKVVGSLKKGLPGYTNDLQKPDSFNISKEEEIELYKNLNKLVKEFISYMKSKLPNANIVSDIDSNYSINNDNSYSEYASVHIYDKNEPNYIENEELYEKYWEKEAKDFIDKVTKTYKDFCKIHKLDDNGDNTSYNDGKIRGTINNYKYIYIDRDDNPDDNLSADFYFKTVFD